MHSKVDMKLIQKKNGYFFRGRNVGNVLARVSKTKIWKKSIHVFITLSGNTCLGRNSFSKEVENDCLGGGGTALRVDGPAK